MSDPTSTTERAKRAQKRPNKSQVRAAQARREHTDAAPPVRTAPVTVSHTQALTPAQRRALERGGVARGTGLPVGVAPLTRGEEMTMIREDLHRLLVIGGILLVGMLALLFVID